MRLPAATRAASAGGLAVCVAAALVLGSSAGIAAAAGPAPNDPLFHSQWDLNAVNASAAWTKSTGKGVIIGFVDTGVDLAHEDLADKVVASTNCVGSNGDVTQCHGTGQDDNGHGTHVAGIAVAVTGNAKGIAGMAPDAKFVVAKSVDTNDSASIADISAGIHWVVDHGAKVVNLSLGNPGLVVTSLFGPSLQDAVEYAWSKGSIPVLAVGNASVLGFGSGSYGNIDAVVVGATGRDGAVTGYSNPTGTAKWALLAPGGSADGSPADDIMSTFWVSGQDNSYKPLAGTDMSAPLVSATIALLMAEGATPATAVSRLLGSVNTQVSCGSGSTNCHGLLNAAAALAAVPSPTTTAVSHPTTTIPTPTTVPTTVQPGGVPPVSTLPPATVPPAAVMSPSHPAAPGSVVTAPAPRPAGDSTTLKDSHVVAVTPFTTHQGKASIAWFVALAALFVAVGAAGVFWVLRMHPAEPD